MSVLFIATSNPGKLREMTPFARTLLGEDWRVEGRAPPLDEETGVTYQENALLKAHALFDALTQAGVRDFAVLSDDSGLAVDALGGRPGIHSARYAGDHVDSSLHIDKLLRELGAATRDPARRTARYHCALALLLSGPPKREFGAEGTCEGRIAESRSGESGFGYDPVFIVPEFDRSFGEIPYEIKNRISHRTRAFEALERELRKAGR